MDYREMMDAKPCRRTVFTIYCSHGERDVVLEDSSEMGCFGPMLSTRGAAFLASLDDFIELVAINGVWPEDTIGV